MAAGVPGGIAIVRGLLHPLKRAETTPDSLEYLDYACGVHGFTALPDDAVLVEPGGNGGCSVSGAGTRRTGGPWAVAFILLALCLAAARWRAGRQSGSP